MKHIFKRDKSGLRKAEESGANYLYVDFTGKIARVFSRFSAKYLNDNDLPQNFICLSVKEYKWITDETRTRKSQTVADIYDKVIWTNRGFVVDGEVVKLR